MKYIGIDYGTKRVGVALSDDDGKLAFPYSVFDNDEKLVEKLASLCEDEKIEQMVIGESTNYEGQDNPVMKEIKRFEEMVKTDCDIPIHFEKEWMTSISARALEEVKKPVANERRQEKKVDRTDDRAAALILQRFLDKQNK